MPSDAKTALPAPSRTPSPPGSPSEVSSHRPLSPVSDQRSHSGKAPVIDPSSSSNQEDLFADTSRDFEFTQRLYGKLNRNLLGLPGDGKIIILSDSDDEKEEARKEKSTGAKDVVASAIVNLASTNSADDVGALAEKSLTPVASPAGANKDPGALPIDSSDGLAPGPKMGRAAMA
jgi:hypothetical protein